MSIVFDAVSGAKDNSGAVTTLTWSHTCTGSNRILVVMGSVTSATPRTVTGITYNAVALTAVASTSAASVYSYMYYLLAPATGANNVVVTISGATDGSNKQFAATAQSYTGAKQSAQPDSSNTNALTSSTVTNFPVSTTVVLPNGWLVGVASEDAGDIAAGAAGANTIYRGASQFNAVGADSNGVVATGSRSLNWGRAGTTGNLSGVVMSIAPLIISFSVSDTVATTETTTFLRGAIFSILDTVATTEIKTFVKGKFFSILDTVTTSDTVSIIFRWIRQALSPTSTTTTTKHSASWTDQSKNSNSTTNQPKNL